MKPQLLRFGESKSPVVIIDDFSGDAERAASFADALGPFPRVAGGSYYPGVRRLIERRDSDANIYVEHLCEQAAQFIAGAFDVDGFDLVEASFSMVTLRPEDLSPPQRAPHFDSTDPKYYALLHYLRVPKGSGTGFYRQQSTGIERVTEDNVSAFIKAAQAEAAMLAPDAGYINGSNHFFEQIGAIDAVPDRLIIYHGSLLHSGIIPAGMNLSSDPRHGRLTTNVFVRGH